MGDVADDMFDEMEMDFLIGTTEDDFFVSRPTVARKPLKCKQCGYSGGAKGLQWKKNEGGKWWLWDTSKNGWHSCNDALPPKAEKPE